MILSNLYRHDSITQFSDKLDMNNYDRSDPNKLIADCIIPLDGIYARRNNIHFKYDSYASAYTLLR